MERLEVTAVLLLLGTGVNANATLARSKGQGGDWTVITSAWGFAVLFGVLTAVSLGAPGHINPAVTIGMAIASNEFSHVGPYILAQLLGAMVGSGLAWLAYLPHWALTDDPAAKLGIFSTSPAIRNLPANFVSELIGTLALLFVIVAIGSKLVALPSYLGPVIVAFLVWGVGLSLGGSTGYAINPARDLGPRIMHAILPIPGKGGSDWAYAWVPVGGPIAGGVIAILIARALGMI
ncbi:MAG: aquaporin [Alphaproteobacteria bacterium HGW-Alphaproteobacteria-11]|nr:MAG: aquaporin [Alphaproteobacteria bacterium HGW-Alphaproteobacteria-11]